MENPLCSQNQRYRDYSADEEEVPRVASTHFEPERTETTYFFRDSAYSLWQVVVNYLAKYKEQGPAQEKGTTEVVTASVSPPPTKDQLITNDYHIILSQDIPTANYNSILIDDDDDDDNGFEDSLIELPQESKTSSALHNFLHKRLEERKLEIVPKASQYGTDLSISLPQLTNSKYQNDYRNRLRGSHFGDSSSPPPTTGDILGSSDIDKITTKKYTESVLNYYIPSEPVASSKIDTVDSLVSNIKINDDVSSRYFKHERELYDQIDRLRLDSISKITPLSTAQQSKIDQVWRSNANNLVVSNFQIEITNNDLKTLQDGRWLNDNIIDYYLNLLVDKNPKVYGWTTHFFTTLESKGYQGVARWAKRRKLNLFEKDTVIVPINIMNTHWALAVIDNAEHKIEYLDSLSTSGNMPAIKLLANYMTQEAKRLNVKPIEYQLLANTKSPQQRNGSDCGVFTCTNARFKAERKNSTFTQNDMKNIRRRMAYEIITKQLL